MGSFIKTIIVNSFVKTIGVGVKKKIFINILLVLIFLRMTIQD